MTREAFLSAMRSLKSFVDLRSVSTPDAVYKSLNLVQFDYRRTSTNGVTLLTVNASFQEVRVTATAKYTKTAAPAGATMVNNGGVKAEAPTPAAAAILKGAK